MYGFAGGAPTLRFDALGLESLDFEGLEALASLIDRTRSSKLVQTMHLGSSINKLSMLIGTVSIRVGGPEYKNHTAYVGLQQFDASTVAHELVHAYNDIQKTGLDADPVRNEGSAYAFEALLRAAWDAKVMEQNLEVSGDYCDAANSGILGRSWPAFWALHGDITAIPAGKVVLPGQLWGRRVLEDFRLDQDDFRNVESIFGFRLSCERFAKVVNARLGNCCQKVTCDKASSSPYLIPAGIVITPCFR